jgi:hypothetical protein
VGAFAGGEGTEQLCDVYPESIDGAHDGLAKKCFEFGEEVLDGVQIGGVGWQKAEGRSGGFDRFPDADHFVAAEIVEHDDISRLEGRTQNFST